MKIEKTAIVIFVAVTLIFGLLTNANANLIVNGSFEQGTDPGVWAQLPNGSTDIVGWVVGPDAIDYKGTYWVASDGGRSLDLDNSPGFGGIMQTFATTPGETYEVTFDFAGNPYPDLDPPIKYMGVSAAGQSAGFFFDVTGHDTTNMGWETHTWQFTATGSSTTLAFYSLDSFGTEHSGIFGPALDNVSVLIIPEPATLSLLGLGSLVLLRKRRA
jgi:choice-of-anchor C domain-containing protein